MPEYYDMKSIGQIYRRTTGTAADLLLYLEYEDYSQDGKHERRFTRAHETMQEIIVHTKKKDGAEMRARISFSKNFTKKHLFCFSKKKNRTETVRHARPSWVKDPHHDAEEILVEGKIIKTLIARSIGDKCRCGHFYKDHTGGGRCKKDNCNCIKFRWKYDQRRWMRGKLIYTPLSGAKTYTLTAVILNWIPIRTFKNTIASAIGDVMGGNNWDAEKDQVGEKVKINFGVKGCVRTFKLVEEGKTGLDEGKAPHGWGGESEPPKEADIALPENYKIQVAEQSGIEATINHYGGGRLWEVCHCAKGCDG